jgi:hypothetical protein
LPCPIWPSTTKNPFQSTTLSTGNVLTVAAALKMEPDKEYAGFKTTIGGAGRRETPVRTVNSSKADRGRRTPRFAHQQPDDKDRGC